MSIAIARYDRDTAFRAECAADVLAGQLVGFNDQGKLVLADADAATPIEAVGFALTDAAAGKLVGVATQGELESGAWAQTVGAKIWLSATAGASTTSRPNSAGSLIQPLGFARSATRLVVHVCPAVGKVQASGSTTVAFV